MTDHTPVPWEWDPAPYECYGCAINTPEWKEGLMIAAMQDTDERAKANAAFIVTACNAHDDLLAALENLEQRFGQLVAEMNYTGQVPEWFDARAAIAAAKGES